MNKILAPLLFVCFLAVGYWTAVESWDGSVYVYLGEQRSPAAARSIRDYSAVDRKALSSSLNKQLLGKAKLKVKNGYLGITLGHPLMKRANAGADFACPVQGRAGIFNQVEMTFMGTGISEAGQPPRMVITAECVPSSNLSELRTIWVPMQQIVAGPAHDQELQVYGEKHPVTIALQGIPDAWPSNWVLESARLYRADNPEEMMAIDTNGVRAAQPKMLSFDWGKLRSTASAK